jgi:hypothetical protein
VGVNREPAPSILAPAVVLAAGVAFSLWLALQAPGDEFYSGDGGLKWLLARQLAGGEAALDLRLDAPGWVRSLWDQGLYPFGPPFAYRVDGAWMLSFPVAFPALTAPFLGLPGGLGLVALPLLALWAAWAAALAWLKRLRVGPLESALALSALVFATPLTLYGALYWEHTLAVAMAAWGLALAGPPDTPSRGRDLAAGALLGLAGWVRPECLLLVALAVGLHLVVAFRSGRPAASLPLALGAGLAIAAFVAFNLAASGRPLGLHAEQVLSAGQDGASSFIDRLDALVRLEVAYAPIAAFVVVAPAVWRGCRGAVALRLAVLAVAFLWAVPAIVPNAGGRQWGPRYLLPLAPVLAVAAGAMLDGARRSHAAPVRWVAVAALVAACVPGIVRNSIDGPVALAADRASRVRPAIDHVRASAPPVVAVAHHDIAMELAAVVAERPFVTVRDRSGFEALAAAARANGAARFPFLNFPAADGADPDAWEPAPGVACRKGPALGAYLAWDCRCGL